MSTSSFLKKVNASFAGDTGAELEG